MQVNLNCKLNSNGVIKFHSASLFACILYIELPNSVPLSISKRRLPSYKVYFCLILLNDRFASLVCFLYLHQMIQRFQYFENYCLYQIIQRFHCSENQFCYFVCFFFTLIKEIDITLRLNLKKKTPSELRKLYIQFAFEISNYMYCYSCLSRVKKNPTVFARNRDLFVVVHTFETHLYLISEVTTACFSTSLLVIHEQGSQHSRRGTSDKQRRRSNTRLSYIVLLYCEFFAFQSAMTPTPLKI